MKELKQASIEVLVVCPKAVTRYWAREAVCVVPEDIPLHIVHYEGKHRAKALRAVRNKHESGILLVISTTNVLQIDAQKLWNGITRATAAESHWTRMAIHSDVVSCHVCPVHSDRWDIMVVDEAHTLRQVHSKRFQSIVTIPYQKCLLLSGTPFNNGATDLTAPCVLMRIDPPVDTWVSHESNTYKHTLVSPIIAAD